MKKEVKDIFGSHSGCVLVVEIFNPESVKHPQANKLVKQKLNSL